MNYVKFILFCFLTSCVSIKTHEKALKKINILKMENRACTADTTEFQILMMKLNKSVHSESLCKRRFKNCNQKLLNTKETFYD